MGPTKKKAASERDTESSSRPGKFTGRGPPLKGGATQHNGASALCRKRQKWPHVFLFKIEAQNNLSRRKCPPLSTEKAKRWGFTMSPEQYDTVSKTLTRVIYYAVLQKREKKKKKIQKTAKQVGASGRIENRRVHSFASKNLWEGTARSPSMGGAGRRSTVEPKGPLWHSTLQRDKVIPWWSKKNGTRTLFRPQNLRSWRTTTSHPTFVGNLRRLTGDFGVHRTSTDAGQIRRVRPSLQRGTDSTCV